MRRCRDWIKDNWGLFTVTLFLGVTVLIVLLRGEDLYIAIHDHLDGTHTQYTMLKDNRLFFAMDAKIPMLGGIDRNLMPAEFKLYSWIFMLLPNFAAMVVNWYLRIIIAVFGFCFLSHILFPEGKKEKNMAAVCGLIYGIFPSFVVEGIHFASLPVLLGILILLYRKPKKRYYLYLLFFPVLSSFVFFGIFICGYLAVFFVIDWIVKRKPAFRILLSIIPLSLGYFWTEWRLFYATLFSDVPSIRLDYQIPTYSLQTALKMGGRAFLFGDEASPSDHILIVLPVCLIFFLYLMIKRIRGHEGKKIFSDPLTWLLLWITFNAFFSGLQNTEGFHLFVDNVLPPLSGFGFSRTLWFNPFLWYLAFFLVLVRLPWARLKNVIMVAALFVVMIWPQMYNPIIFNVPGVYETYCRITGKEYHLSYEEFYSSALFDKIKEDIGYNGEWSAAYGMHPAVLQYNKISTLDGYFTLYPLAYKEAFRRVIAPELEEYEWARAYYDDWGGRAYLFSDEVSFEPVRSMAAENAQLQIDPKAFCELGGKYIFSRVSLRNAAELGLEEIGKYQDDGSPYTIYVYALADKELAG